MSESYPIRRDIILDSDSQRVIHDHVLRPGEKLLTFHPTDGTTLHCKIPGRKSDGRARMPWYLGIVCYPFIVVYILLRWGMVVITDGLFDPMKDNTRLNLFAAGSQRDCRAGELAGRNAHGEGIWFVTDHRVGLVAVNLNRRQKRKLASAREGAVSGREPSPKWNAALYVEVPAREFRVEGPFDRDTPGTGKGRPEFQKTVYRLQFHDGSEFDIPQSDENSATRGSKTDSESRTAE